MGLIEKPKLLELLGPQLTKAFNLENLPPQILAGRWNGTGPNGPYFHATNSSLVIAPHDDMASIPSFSVKLDSSNPKLAVFGLYAEISGDPEPPFKGNATEFLIRTIKFLSHISPHGTVTGIISQWHVNQRNHSMFFESYDPAKDNYVEAAKRTWTGIRAIEHCGFKNIRKAPGIDLIDKSKYLSLIFSK